MHIDHCLQASGHWRNQIFQLFSCNVLPLFFRLLFKYWSITYRVSSNFPLQYFSNELFNIHIRSLWWWVQLPRSIIQQPILHYCLGSLSCWKIQLQPLIMTKLPTPDAATAPQTITLPPPCVTIEIRCLRPMAVLGFLQTFDLQSYPKFWFIRKKNAIPELKILMIFICFLRNQNVLHCFSRLWEASCEEFCRKVLFVAYTLRFWLTLLRMKEMNPTGELLWAATSRFTLERVRFRKVFINCLHRRLS